MPREIQEGPIELNDPFIGADPDEEADTTNVDYGNDFDAQDSGETADLENIPDEAPAKETPAEEKPAEETPADEPVVEEPTEPVEPEAAVEPEPPVDEGKKQRIPKDRFDEVNEKRKIAENRVKELEAAQAAAAAAKQGKFDFDAAEQQYMEAVVDGEFAKAQAIRKEIRAAETEQYTNLARSEAAASREQTKVELAFQDTVMDLEAQYPEFAKDSDVYDSDLVEEVLVLHEGFLNKGYDPNTAIRKAVKYVAAANDIVPSAERGAPSAKDSAPSTPKVGAKPVTQAAARAKTQAKVAQPQTLPRGGAPETASTLDMVLISEEEFDALPESKKKELRGDFA